MVQIERKAERGVKMRWTEREVRQAVVIWILIGVSLAMIFGFVFLLTWVISVGAFALVVIVFDSIENKEIKEIFRRLLTLEAKRIKGKYWINRDDFLREIRNLEREWYGKDDSVEV